MTTDLATLGQTLKRAQHRNHRAMDSALRRVGVGLVQWDALRAVADLPGASAHELAVATFQSDQAFGTLATRLVDQQLIERSAGRGRRLQHTLTEEGRALLEEGHRISASLLPTLFAPLSEAQRRDLLHALRSLTEPDDVTGAD